MRSQIIFNDENAKQLLKAIEQRLINPAYEVQHTAIAIEAEIEDHFNKEMGPAGRWRPRKDPRGTWKILSKSRALRRGLKAVTSIKPNGISVEVVPSQETAKYAYVHNNGLRIRNRSGRFTAMPKRQYVWVSARVKKEIAELWSRGF